MRIIKISENMQMEFPFAINMASSYGGSVNSSEESNDNISVHQVLEANDGYISRFVLYAIIKQNKLKTRVFPGLIEVFETKKLFLEEYGKDEYHLIEEICDWICNMDDSDALEILQIKEEDIYSRYFECTMKDLRENPGLVYHWTTEDKWDEIQSSRKINGSRGTGLNNRSDFGIFASVKPEEYALGTYGNICLEIDLGRFKQDQGLESLELNHESEVLSYMIREALTHTLDIECVMDQPNDISPYTVVIGHSMPLKYVKRLN